MIGLAPVSKTHVSELELARLVGASPSTVAKWRRKGRLPNSIKIGGTRYFEREAVAEFLRRGN